MKKLVLVILSVIVVFQLQAQSKFTCPTGEFSAKFPGEPQYTVSDIDADNSTVKLHNYMYEGDNMVYLVAFVNYQEGFMGTLPAVDYMENVVGGFFSELQIEPGSRKEVKNGKYQGLEYYGKNSSYSVAYRVYIAKNSMFQVAILNVGEMVPEKLSASFFKSFKIKVK